MKKLHSEVYSALIIMNKAIIILSIYCLSDLGVSSNLNGLVRYLGVTEIFHSLRSQGCVIRSHIIDIEAKQNKMTSLSSHFEMSIESTLIGFLQQMLRWSVVDITSYVCTETIILFNLVK